MISDLLEKARQYEKAAEPAIPGGLRPAYHFTAPSGWLNDPNGLCRYQDRYHMFFQYYPYASHWNQMHWGHAVSDDLLHWEYLPAALAPDRDYDGFGCFSGTAAELGDGRLLLMYTSVCSKEQPGHVVREIQTQSVAVGDGINYEKYAGNPVIGTGMLPEGGNPFDFRDPYISRRTGGGYYCFVAGRNEESGGLVLLYESPDGFRWQYVKTIVRNDYRFGTMWECPNFFPLDGRHVLIFSATNMLAKGLDYQAGNHVVCLTGDLDEKTMTFTETGNMTVDYGIDFYAPQVFQAPDGRTIMIGWMQNVDAFSIRPADSPWAGQMSIPRELSLRGGQLYQKPIRELDNLHRNEVAFTDIIVADTACEPDGIRGRIVDLTLRIRPAADTIYRAFEMRFAQNEDYYTSLRFCPETAILQVDRTFSGIRRAILNQAQCRIDTDVSDLNLRILIDRYSVEVFVEDGRKVMTTTLYTEESAERITFHADGAVRLDIRKYDIGDD